MSKSSRIAKISIAPLNAPLIQNFRTALGDHPVMENVLFTMELGDGTKGWGEAAVAGHITGETVSGTMANLQNVGESFLDRDVADYLRLSAELHERLPDNTSAVAAIEMSLLDALTRQWKIPLWKFFGTKPQRLVSDVTIVIADLAETEDAVKRFFKEGFRIFKVKVGRDEELDFERVVAVHRLAPRSTIYLDANQGYSADQTLKFLKKLQRVKIRPALIEQPVPRADREGLARVARLTDIPVCADESASSLSDAVRLVREKAVDAINVKFMKTGIFHSREIASLGRAAGIKLMIGGMMESSLAMTASAHFAAGLGCFDYIDLDTPFFIKKPYDKNPYLSSRGVYDLKKVKAGIGITKEG